MTRDFAVGGTIVLLLVGLMVYGFLKADEVWDGCREAKQAWEAQAVTQHGAGNDTAAAFSLTMADRDCPPHPNGSQQP